MTANDEDKPQDFAAVLMQHSKGRAHTEASRLLHDLVAAVRETGKTGAVTVKLKVSQDKAAGVIKVEDSVTATVPTDTRRSLWFPDEDNNLHRNHPGQHEINYATGAGVANRNEER